VSDAEGGGGGGAAAMLAEEECEVGLGGQIVLNLAKPSFCAVASE
jgi:hypothetical protein